MNKTRSTTPILEWKDLDVRKKTLFEQHTFQAKTKSGTYRISAGRDELLPGGHDVIFCKPRKAGYHWKGHAATLEQAKEMAQAHAAEGAKLDETKAVTKKPALLTAAQVKKACPTDVEYWGNQIVGHYKTALQYEGKAEQQWNSIAQYLAKAKKACNTGGFAAFRERFCPDLGRTRVYELLRIGSGEKTVEDTRAETAGRMKKHRAAQKAAAEQEPKLVRHVTDKSSDVSVRLNGGQPIDIEDLGPKAQAQLAEKLLPAATGRSAADEQWQHSLANMAGDAVSLRAFWKKTFGDWEKFEVPTELLELTKQAALAWDQLATDLAKDVVVTDKDPEERKAEIERREGSPFITDEEFKALTADELRDLLGNLLFANSLVENFDHLMEMTADELREEVRQAGIFGGVFYGVIRGKDGDLYLYYD